MYRGYTRTDDEARFTSLHACQFSTAYQPDHNTNLVIAWSHASLQYAPQTDGHSIMPCVAERLSDTIAFSSQGVWQAVAASRMSSVTYTDAEAPRLSEVSGITRSFISFRMFIDLTSFRSCR